MKTIEEIDARIMKIVDSLSDVDKSRLIADLVRLGRLCIFVNHNPTTYEIIGAEVIDPATIFLNIKTNKWSQRIKGCPVVDFEEHELIVATTQDSRFAP